MRLPTENLAAWVSRLKWIKTARSAQLTPKGDWQIWLILAGRGWGKTRTGAEDIAAYVLWHKGVRVGVIAPTFGDARDVCIEGNSGLLNCLPPVCVTAWHRSTGELLLFNGSRIKIYSADQPDRLRGPQHHRVWCDELGAWPNRDAFDQMQFGLRLGPDPRVIITTTPRNTDVIRELLRRKDAGVRLTHGRTIDNIAHLAPRVLDQLTERYAGTRLGRQELDAELLEDNESALWQRSQLDKCRVAEAPMLRRIVVAIDPAMSSHAGSDETGIVAAGRAVDGTYYVLEDWSCRAKPDQWAKRAVMLYEQVHAQMIVAEVNAGGELVERMLRSVAPEILFKSVHAMKNKTERAMPVAAMYEQGRVKHVGAMAVLEDQMCNFAPSRPGTNSPDRVDALVWAITELMEVGRSEPRIRIL